MNYEKIYDDGIVMLEVDKPKHSYHLKMRPGVTTLMVRNGKIILIEDKKTDHDHWLWNCPGGMIKPDETNEEGAARECQEETGLRPTKLEKFATIATDFPDTYVEYYVGAELIEGPKAPWIEAREGTENIGQIKEHTWNELYQFALNYELRDPRFVVAVLKLAKQPELLKKYGLIV